MGLLDGWTFCPRCGAQLTPAAESVACGACRFVAYANPAVAACAACVDADGRVLLARRAVDPYAGCWDLPGGFVAEYEHPLDALRRELREETGLEVEPVEFLGIWTDTYGEGGNGTLNLCWTARVVSGDAAPADDVSELAWFPRDELPPPDELAFDNVAAALGALLSIPPARPVGSDGSQAKACDPEAGTASDALNRWRQEQP